MESSNNSRSEVDRWGQLYELSMIQLAVILFLYVILIDQANANMYHPLKPTGKYGISRVSQTLIDKSRVDPHNVSSKRKLSIDIYYPTAKNIDLRFYDKRAIQYWTQADYWSSSQKKILSQELKKIYSYTSIDEQFSSASKKHPTIIFSHGFGAWAGFYSYLIEDLVSHGFMVVGINHTYNSGISEINGEVIYGRMTHEELFKSYFGADEQNLWIEDVSFVIDKIKSTDLELLQRANMDKLFMMGQSFGGSTATHFSQFNQGFIGCINLDGAVFGEKVVEEVKVPLLILMGGESIKSMDFPGSETDLSKKLGISVQQAKDFKEAYLTRLMRLKNIELVQLKVLKGIDHIGFTDFNFLTQSTLFKDAPIGLIPGDQMIERIRNEVMTFVQKLTCTI